ncbi:MAG: hypothetical protein ACK5NG_06590 [Chthoniobacterales bacterium]
MKIVFTRLIQFLAVAGVLFLLALWAIHGIVNFTTASKWQLQQQRIRDKEGILTYSDMGDTEVADKNNFLKSRIITDDELSKNVTLIEYILTRSQDLQPDVFQGRPRNFEKFVEILKTEKLLPDYLSTDDALRSILQLTNPWMEEFRLAETRETVSFGNIQERVDSNERFATLMKVPRMASFIRLRVAIEAHLGNGNAAKRDIISLVHLINLCKKNSQLTILLVRWDVVLVLSDAIWEGIAAGCWTDSDLIEIQQQLGAIDLSEDLAAYLLTERAFLIDTLEKYGNDGGYSRLVHDTSHLRQDGTIPDNMDISEKLGILDALWSRPRGLIFNELGKISEITSSLIQTSQKNPFSEDIEKKILQTTRNLSKFPNNFIYIITPMTLRSLLSVQLAVMYSETRLREAWIACALERYYIQNKEYPESINISGVRELEDLPLDPFAENRPFNYERLSSNSYRLWSIGYNRKNENGSGRPPKNDISNGDIVWQSAQPSSGTK